jgi:selenocysteine lyase/cysteine desulfurase
MATQDLIQTWRKDTPGVDNYIHLNNAGAALPPSSVTSTMVEYLQAEAQTGGYELAANRRKAIDDFYLQVGRLVGVPPEQIAYTTNATDAYNRALSSIPWKKGDVIITTVNDYSSNQIAFLQLHRRFGVEVIRAAESSRGGVSLSDITRLIREKQPKLVAVTHVPTNSGLIQPVEAIGSICAGLGGCWYLVDACQSAGQLPLDLKEIGADFLTATFRKFLRGPRGAGFLACSKRVLEAGLEPLFLDLHSAEWDAPDNYLPADTAKRFELWERSYALVLGAAEAARYALAIGLPTIARHVQILAHYTRWQLASVPAIELLDRGPHLCGITSFHIPSTHPGRLMLHLRRAGIHCSVAYLPNAPLDLQQKGVEWAMRFAPHYYNTKEEIDQAVAQLKSFVHSS